PDRERYIAAPVASRTLRSADGQSNGRSDVRLRPATEARAGNAARSEIHTAAETRSSGLRTNPSTQCRKRDYAERTTSPATVAAFRSSTRRTTSIRHRCAWLRLQPLDNDSPCRSRKLYPFDSQSPTNQKMITD